jgi:hypothetical protein
MNSTEAPIATPISDESAEPKIVEQLRSTVDAAEKQDGLEEKVLTTSATSVPTAQSVAGLTERYRQVVELAQKGNFQPDVVFEVLRMEATEWRVEGDKPPSDASEPVRPQVNEAEGVSPAIAPQAVKSE